ncbi:hypothetical protein FWF48_00030 [Candidatus Saccharibacteria bacterium]|nr:hypothetical protein [Candidatus Saccharibacteria bacterium]
MKKKNLPAIRYLLSIAILLLMVLGFTVYNSDVYGASNFVMKNYGYAQPCSDGYWLKSACLKANSLPCRAEVNKADYESCVKKGCAALSTDVYKNACFYFATGPATGTPRTNNDPKLKTSDFAEPTAFNATTGKFTTGASLGGGSSNSGSTGVKGCDETSIISVDCDDKGSGIWGLLGIILNIMTVGVGILAVAGIAFAAVIYITAEGSPDRLKKAKTWIFNVVLGLVLYGLLWAIMQFFVPGGVFN